MFLKVLAFLWLIYGAPFQQYMGTVWSGRIHQTQLIRQAILSANADRGLVNQLQAKALSKKLVRISHCLEMDPVLFTALVWRESHFQQQAQSETGAVGITQLTTSGIHEVLDRLAEKSPRKSDEIRQHLSRCEPRLLRQIPSSVISVDFKEWKKKVAASPELALVFGAVLFKSYHHGDDRQALEKYNGDPRVKTRFANDVLALTYWIASSFKVIPENPEGSSKFLVSIQDL
jgi:hypothetical protein